MSVLNASESGKVGIKLPNPLIPGFNPDPSIVRVGEDYYLATSTFEFLPGLPIYHSRNLIDWQLIGHVVTREGQMQMIGVPTIGGAWAPTIRYRDGLFYVVVTDSMGRGTLIFTAENPAGPWSDGIVTDVQGIDPDIAWDADGTCFMTYSGLILHGISKGKHIHLGIQQVRIDETTGKMLEEPRNIWSGTGLMFPEAPHLYELDGYWYLLIAEGGTSRGHAVSIARGLHPAGPFEGAPTNPILSARSTSRAVQNTGHGDLVQTPTGEWIMVLLGMRPGGMTRAFSPLGRETFAANVTWADGWPVVEPVELNDVLPAPEFVDTFDSPELSGEWITIRRLAENFVTKKSGSVVLVGDGRTLEHEAPVFFGRRQRRLEGIIRAHVAVSGVGGLTVRYDENAHYDIEVAGDQIIARSVLQHNEKEIAVSAPMGDRITLFLKLEKPDGSDTPSLQTSDIIRLGFLNSDGSENIVASFDGRYLSAEVNCSFTGRSIGVYSTSGSLELYRYEEVAK
jgi:beta-xylosidase